VLVLVDRLLLLAEERGIVYWRRSPPPAGTVGSAMLSVQGLVEPGAEQLVEERRRSQADIHVADDDDPLDPGSRGASSPT
jgi:hypothetical protein